MMIFPTQPIKKQQATVRPPHARFHPVPTDYVFATRKQYHPPQPLKAPNEKSKEFPFPSPHAIPPMFFVPEEPDKTKTLPKPLIKEVSPTEDFLPPLPDNSSHKPMQTDDIPPLPKD